MRADSCCLLSLLARKTQGFIRAGIVERSSLRFAIPHRTAVEEVAPRRARELDAWFGTSLEAIYRGEPLRPLRDVVDAVTGPGG